MHKRTIPVVAVIFLVIGLVGMAVTMTYLQSAGSYTGYVGGSGTRGPMMAGNMDAMFIEQMIPHHDDAIAMAELALTRAEHPELKQLAEDIK
ncbi:MAG: DUF305 domain-containing protein, partial [Coriobacteriia bacterium]|nr:DUF305 domain-containing protein [Coriobacteriia bacterium]